MTHINLNDGTCAGLTFPAMNAMSIQYHPESSPGPHDSDQGKLYIFGLSNEFLLVFDVLSPISQFLSPVGFNEVFTKFQSYLE